MDQFVRVRLIQVNSIDLDLFQFDYDLTFAAFFLNADKTIYGRFGTRSSHDEASRDISITGFRKAMEGALELHRNYPNNRASLIKKTGPAAQFKIAQDYPSLTGRFTPFLDYQGQVARSCIHCHMLGEAQRKVARSNSGAMPDSVIYPWPMPNVIGLEMNPNEMATIKRVVPGSIAAQQGFLAGDVIERLEGQPLLSTADIQWVLNQAVAPATLRAEISREGKKQQLSLPLRADWRRPSDISWRTTSWDLRRIATGGLLLKSLSPFERQTIQLSAAQMGLRVEHVGQYGDHAVAKRAGFLKNDIIVSFDSLAGDIRETDLFAHILRHRAAGDEIPVSVIRSGERKNFKLRIQ